MIYSLDEKKTKQKRDIFSNIIRFVLQEFLNTLFDNRFTNPQISDDQHAHYSSQNFKIALIIIYSLQPILRLQISLRLI